MDIEKKTTLINMGIGVGAVLITLFMTSGEWDIFDFGISLFICYGLYHSIKKNYLVFKEKSERIIVSFMLSCISTALIVSFLSIVAAITSSSFLATVDERTYEKVSYNKGHNLIRYQISIYTVSNLEAQDGINEDKLNDIKHKLKSVSGKEFKSKNSLYLEIDKALKDFPKETIKRIKNQLKFSNSIDQRSLKYQRQILWQITIYILCVFVWYIFLNSSLIEYEKPFDSTEQ